MRIAIVTLGRFHVLDLARELDRAGHQVAFWSIVPRSRAVAFGLPPKAHRALLPVLAPLVAAHRYGGPALSGATNRILKTAMDRIVARFLEPCDLLIGMSGLTVETARAARDRYGAAVFIERGSRHILSQQAILDDIARLSSSAETVRAWAVGRELATYDAADVIVVPSRHAVDSFIERGVPRDRIFKNPYGVDLDMFKPTPAPPEDQPRVIYVGRWSYRKGCDVLAEALRILRGRVRLIHVGDAGDAPLPRDEWFQHVGPVPQRQLRDHYARAHAFVLASREEGLALVQAQALACGLPVVCTDRTGGEDLKELVGVGDEISVVPHDDPGHLAAAIDQALARAQRRFPHHAVRDLLAEARNRLSWRSYGQRYSAKIVEAVTGLSAAAPQL